MTDKPLVDALILTRTARQGPRYGLVSADSVGIHRTDGGMAKDLRRYVEMRGDAIGIDILVPDFHVQIGQFVQELYLAWSLPGDYDSYRYSQRLDNWSAKWFEQANESSEMDSSIYQKLSLGLRRIRALMMVRGAIGAGLAQADEHLRLELRRVEAQ